jgi:hypothetical protein
MHFASRKTIQYANSLPAFSISRHLYYFGLTLLLQPSFHALIPCTSPSNFCYFLFISEGCKGYRLARKLQNLAQGDRGLLSSLLSLATKYSRSSRLLTLLYVCSHVRLCWAPLGAENLMVDWQNDPERSGRLFPLIHKLPRCRPRLSVHRLLRDSHEVADSRCDQADASQSDARAHGERHHGV